MHRTMSWLTLAALLLVSHAAGADKGTSDAVRLAIADYKTWKPTTTAPIFVPDLASAACRPAAATPGERSSPHEGRHIVVYVNPTGRDAYDRKASFPDGTVIVKQKRVKPEDDKSVALGVMTKHGTSWEYSYIDAAGKTAVGEQLLHCARCHARATNDSVFGRAQAAPAPNAPPGTNGPGNTNGPAKGNGSF